MCLGGEKQEILENESNSVCATAGCECHENDHIYAVGVLNELITEDQKQRDK